MDNGKRIENAFLYIEAAYARLQKTGKINIREQQVTLSKDIAKAFIEGTTLVAEAPTGTGKTLAYMVGAMAARRTHAEGEPLVVSTATKALQQQLLSSDLPVLTEAGVLAEHVGWEMFFVVTAATGLPAIILAFLLLKVAHPDRMQRPGIQG